MQGGFLTNVLLPVALGVIMLGLGLSLTLADFKRVLVYPRAVLVGLLCQTVLLPAVAFGVTKALGLPPELAVGMMLLAASPGGATANLFSHLAHGDVALNITLTATNSLLSLLTLPLLVSASLTHFLGDARAVPLQAGKVLQVFSIILAPVALGMLARARSPSLAARLERPVRVLSAVFLALVIGASLVKERSNVLGFLQQVGSAALLFNLLSLGVGYLVPRALRLPKRQAVAIGMEIGIHNGTLAMAVANTVLGRPVMAIPAAVYGLVMFFTAALFGYLVRVREEP